MMGGRVLASETASLWATAAGYDATLTLRRGDDSALQQRQIVPQRYSRERLFAKIAAACPVIFIQISRFGSTARRRGLSPTGWRQSIAKDSRVPSARACRPGPRRRAARCPCGK